MFWGRCRRNTAEDWFLFCWDPFSVEVVVRSSNFLFCKISTINGTEWHCLFLYGAPHISQRQSIWHQIHHLLVPFSKYLIVGDINQVDHYSDKLGGSPVIRGWEDFLSWKFNLHLLDIPFSGPRYTWTNNMDSEDLIMERLD